MRKHEWETLTKIYEVTLRLTNSLERIADHLTGTTAEAEAEKVEVAVEDSPSKVKRSKKSKDAPESVPSSEETFE